MRGWQKAYRGIMPDDYLDSLDDDLPARQARMKVMIISPPEPGMIQFVAEHDRRVVGYVATGPSRDEGAPVLTGEIYALYVHPEKWRAGAGSALMTTALEHLQAEGFTEATLWVFEENKGARGFYERHKFRHDGSTEIFERGGGQAIEIRYRRPLEGV